MKRSANSIFMGLLLIVLVSCSGDSETMSPKVPEFSWAPEITLGPVGYQRFEIFISAPPQELREHIRSYTVSAIGINGTTSTFSELVDVRASFFRQYYYPLSEVLEENGQYQAHITILYNDGTQKKSNLVEFSVPETKGEILAEQKIPNSWEGRPLSGLSISEESYFQYSGRDIFEYDASSGEVGIISSDVTSGYVASFTSLGNIKAVLWHNLTMPGGIYGYQILDTSTSTLSSLVEIEFGSIINVVDLLCANDSLMLVYVEYNNLENVYERHFRFYSTNTGRLKRTFAALPLDQPYNFGSFAMVGDTVWRAFPDYFDSRLQRIDLTTGEILEELALPVLNFDALQHYDGYFWLRENMFSMENATRALKVVPEAF